MLHWTLSLLLLTPVGWPFGGKKKADTTAFAQALAAAVPAGTAHAVVLQHGIPASAASDPGLVKHDKQYTVDVADGNWSTPFEGTSFWDDHLRWTEVVRVDDVQVKKGRVEVRVVSLENRMVPGGLIGSDRPGPIATLFRLALPSEAPGPDDVPTVLRNLEPLVKVLGSEREAREFSEALRAGGSAELPAPTRSPTLSRPGMMQPDVRDLLGPPRSERIRGRRTIWLYPGEEVVFEDGRVVEVHAR